MPRKTVEDELDDLDLDDLVEDEVEEDDDEEFEDDPDEAPKAKRSRKAKAAKPKKEKVGIGTKELAEEAGVEPRQLRAFLRSAGYQPRDEREGRYSWPSLRDPEAREIVKKVKSGAIDKLNKEKLADLKEKKAPAKKSTSRKRASASK
jgi:hypothetical protein